jgi:hypothetical protein
VRVVIDISHHGGQKGEIDCELVDSGAADIPAALVDGLIALGVAGFPSLQVIRESVGATVVGQRRIELTLSSSVTRELQIPGLVSCDEPGTKGACPDDQVCQANWTCG